MHLTKLSERLGSRRSRSPRRDGRARAARRWDNCFIRLLDGMLQVLGFADADGGDHALRIPVRIRHIEIGAPGGAAAPALPCDAQRALGRVATPLAAIQGLELAAAPRSAAAQTTKCDPSRERPERGRRCGIPQHMQCMQ